MGHLHDARREQLGVADDGSLPEDDLASAAVGRDDQEGQPWHNVMHAAGNGDTMRCEQARGAENLARTRTYGPRPDDRGHPRRRP